MLSTVSADTNVAWPAFGRMQRVLDAFFQYSPLQQIRISSRRGKAGEDYFWKVAQQPSACFALTKL
jgi:hypothetical protein